MEAVGLYLRGLREDKRLTQAEAAALTKIASKTVERWEGGDHEPKMTQLEAYVKALGGSVAEVVRLLVGVDISMESDELAVISRLPPHQRRLVAELARQMLHEELSEG